MTDLLIQRHPVNVEFCGAGEIKSSNIAFEDYARMSTQTHKLNKGRRYEAPAWALNDDSTRAVLTRYMESRANFRYAQEGTDAERLERARLQLQKQRPELVARIDRLCAALVAAKRDGLHDAAAAISQKVEETDTQILVLEDIHKRVVGIIYLYWRVGYNSVEVGQQLGLKPPHVRGLLTRLLITAAQLGYAPPDLVTPKGEVTCYTRRARRTVEQQREARATQLRVAREQLRLVREEERDKIIALRKEGKFTVDIAKALGLGKDGSIIVTRILIQAGAA